MKDAVLRSWLGHWGEFKLHLTGLEMLVGRDFQRSSLLQDCCQQETRLAVTLSGHGVNTSKDGDSPGAGASIPSTAPQQGEMGM